MAKVADFLIRALGGIPAHEKRASLSPVDNRGGWWPVIREGFTGAWQTGVKVSVTDVLQQWAVFRSVSLIASDIAKMRLKLVELSPDGIWYETANPAFSPVIRKPNHFQTRIQFFQNWMESKLSRGNTYVLKQFDARGVVVGLTILSPDLVRPLVAENGEVFYSLSKDNIAGLTGVADVTVPADYIIHDRWNTLYHPLVGLSPIYACGMQAMAGLQVTQNTYRLFKNGSKPSGIITAPASISQEHADRIKDYWGENFTGDKAGNVAVLGDGLEYVALTMNAVDAQLIQQLEWEDKTIFGCFGIPAHMTNAGNAPAYNNVEALSLQYFQQCLQIHIEGIELLLDEALGLPEVKGKTYGVEFDLDDLLRMDTPTKVKTAIEGLKGLWSADEARRKFDLPPTAGGRAVLSQQQNYSLEALAKRDAKDDPFGTAPAALPPPKPDDEEQAELEKHVELLDTMVDHVREQVWDLNEKVSKVIDHAPHVAPVNGDASDFLPSEIEVTPGAAHAGLA